MYHCSRPLGFAVEVSQIALRSQQETDRRSSKGTMNRQALAEATSLHDGPVPVYLMEEIASAWKLLLLLLQLNRRHVSVLIFLVSRL